MDALNPRAVLGGNLPPLGERLAADHASLVQRAADAVAGIPADLAAIQTEEEAKAYTDQAKDLKDLLGEADDAFTPEKEPWLTGGRTVDSFFAFRANIKAAIARLVGKLNDYANAKLAAQRKAEAEERERLRKEAEAFDEAPTAFVPAPIRDTVRIVSDSGTKASGTVKWTYRVTDAKKVPKKFLMVNEAAIKAAVDGGERTIAGVDIFEAVRTAIR